jgi:hypothetical protein
MLPRPPAIRHRNLAEHRSRQAQTLKPPQGVDQLGLHVPRADGFTAFWTLGPRSNLDEHPLQERQPRSGPQSVRVSRAPLARAGQHLACTQIAVPELYPALRGRQPLF